DASAGKLVRINWPGELSRFAARRKSATPDGVEHTANHEAHAANRQKRAQESKPVADWEILVNDKHHYADSDEEHAPDHPVEHAADHCLFSLGLVQLSLHGSGRAGVLCDEL